MARKRKLKKSVKKVLILFIFILFILFYFSLNRNNSESTNDKKNINYSIVDKSENDKDVVNKMFAKGMSVDSFNELLGHDLNTIESTSDYETIKYNFNKSLSYSDIEEYLNKLNKSLKTRLYFNIFKTTKR